MALTRNSIFNLSKAFQRPSSVFIGRQVWKGGDVVTEDNEEKGNKSNGDDKYDNRTAGEERKVAEKSKERAAETAQEAWRAIEEAAAEMKQTVVANIDNEYKETEK